MPGPDKFIEMGRTELDPTDHTATAPENAWGVFAHYCGISSIAYTELVAVREDKDEAGLLAAEYDGLHGHMTLEVEDDPESNVWSQCWVTVERVARTAMRAAVIVEAVYAPVGTGAGQPE